MREELLEWQRPAIDELDATS
jgi:hypothetical protein